MHNDLYAEHYKHHFKLVGAVSTPQWNISFDFCPSWFLSFVYNLMHIELESVRKS